MKLPTQAQSLLAKYAEQPETKDLTQFGIGVVVQALVPKAGAISGSVLQLFNGIIARRATQFLEALVNGGTSIDKRFLDSEEFLHCFIATTKRAVNTSRNDIEMLARLLKAPERGGGGSPGHR